MTSMEDRVGGGGMMFLDDGEQNLVELSAEITAECSRQLAGNSEKKKPKK